jgi:DNA-binding CsgD family transcriptional regulator/tetratricopeptide (TPR) repeat protein
MSTVEAFPTLDNADKVLSTESPALTLVRSPGGKTHHHPDGSGPLFGDGRPEQGALASIFADLFRPVDLASGGPGGSEPAKEVGDVDLQEDSEALYVVAAALLAVGQTVQAANLLRRLDALPSPDSDWRQWRARLEFLWAVYAEQTGDMFGVLERAEEATRLTGAISPRPMEVGEIHRSRLLQTIDRVTSEQLPLLSARAKIALGEPHEARTILADSYGGVETAALRQPATMARLACGQGRLNDALRLTAVALQNGDRTDAGARVASCEARVVLAEVLFERDALEAAQEQLEAALQCAATDGGTYTWIVVTYLARLSVAQHRVADALPRLRDLRQVRQSGCLQLPAMRVLNQVEIDCYIQLGDVKAALRTVRDGPPEHFYAETLAQVDLCCGRPDRVIAQLRTGKSPSLAQHIRRLILLACAEKQQGRTGKATEWTRRAVAAAEPEQYIRPFLEHTTQMFPLLCSMGTSSPDRYLARLIRQTEADASTTGMPADATVLEPLSERERQVLQYLPSHRTVSQIAGLMFLSTNTVKTHIKAIYRKTGASSRDEAVIIATSHGLV